MSLRHCNFSENLKKIIKLLRLCLKVFAAFSTLVFKHLVVNVSVSLPVGELMEAIKRDFGSFQKMKEKMSAAAVAVQGSGWSWLGFNKDNGRLSIAACANQDPLQGTTGRLHNKLNKFTHNVLTNMTYVIELSNVVCL